MDNAGNLEEGLLGTFWALGSGHRGSLRAKDGVPGHVQIRDNSVVLKVQETRGDLEPDLRDVFERNRQDQVLEPGRWIFGVTEAGSIIIPASARKGEPSRSGADQKSAPTSRHR